MDYIKRIKEVKSARKMTNDELSERTGIPGGTLSKILAGISETPKFCNIVAICEALNCSLDYIVYGLEENKNNYTLSDEEIEMIEDYRALDARGQETVAALIESEGTYAPRTARMPLRKGAKILSPEPLSERLTAAYAANSNGLARIPLPLFDLPVSAGPGVALDYDDADTIMVRDTTRTREADFALRISGNSMEPRYHDGDILLVQEAQTLEYGELGIFILDGCGFFKVFGGDRLYSLNENYGDILLKDFEDVRVAGRVIGKLKKR
ncbi:MAG: helix-turn-helix domain-containing protein [Clostridia bacterium]|nr:helix-turn-helix domain-containing protein [Clostridia bacterium]